MNEVAPPRHPGAWIVTPARVLAVVCGLMAAQIWIRAAISDDPPVGAHWTGAAFLSMGILFLGQSASVASGNRRAQIIMLVAATATMFFGWLWLSSLAAAETTSTG